MEQENLQERILEESPAVDLRSARRSFSRLGLGIFLYLLSGALLQGLAMVLAELLFPGWMEHPWGMWIVGYVPLYGIATPIALLLLRRVPALLPAQKALAPGEVAVIAIICFFMMYAGNLTGILLTSLLQLIPGVTALNPVLDMTGGTALLPRLLVMVVAAPLVEEYIFRKQLIDRMQRYGQKTAVILSALLFGLFHGNFSQFFYAFALGLVFGYVYVKTGRLRYSIGLHMMINLLGGVAAPALLEHLPLSPDGMLDLEKAMQAPGWILLYMFYAFALVGLSIAGLVLLCVNRKKITFSTAERELPRQARFKTACCNLGMLLALLGCCGLMALSLFST